MSSDRREFLKHVALMSGSLILPACKTVGRANAKAESILNASPVNNYLPKRVNWNSLSSQDKTAFIEAVKGMSEEVLQVPDSFGGLGPRKLSHWAAQAECHKLYCKHRTSSFLPWHRSYLYNFELCLRKRIRDSFRLPYWDWTVDFSVPIELQNEAFLKKLGVKRNSNKIGEPDSLFWKTSLSEVAKEVDYDSIGGDEDSSGLIEAPYHNTVHVNIGGQMGQVPIAAQDPIFWLHHCNVDRLWSIWMDQMITAGKIRAMFPSTDVSGWLNQSFTNQYWNAQGVLASATVKSSLFTEGLDYNYDTMKNTWTLVDIPSDQATAVKSSKIDDLENVTAGLGLAKVPGSALRLNFSLPEGLFDSPQNLLSLRLKVSGIAQPTDGELSFAADLAVGGKSFALAPISFFPGAHDQHGSGMIGLSLNKYMNTIRSIVKDKGLGHLTLSLRNKDGQAVAIADAFPNLSLDASSYGLTWKAVFA